MDEVIPDPKRGGTRLYCGMVWRTTEGRRVQVHSCLANFGKIRGKAYKKYRRHWLQAHTGQDPRDPRGPR